MAKINVPAELAERRFGRVLAGLLHERHVPRPHGPAGATCSSSASSARRSPIKSTPAAPVAGAGGPYKFTATSGHVTGCTDKHGASANLQTCLAAAAYSSAFKFGTDRVIAK